MEISKSKDFGFSYVALKGNNAIEFLLNNRKTVPMSFVAECQHSCWLAQKTSYDFPII